MYTAPTLRMPRQCAGINRHTSAPGATAGGGVEAAIVPELLLAYQLLSNPQETIDSISHTVDQVVSTVEGVVDGIGSFFSGLFS